MSLCCGADDCRRRTLPPSVLFWDRRVYWGGVILVLVALREGRNRGYTADRLYQLFGVTRLTLDRWLNYFHRIFPSTATWQILSSRLFSQTDPTTFRVNELLTWFVQARGSPQAALVACLQTLRLADPCPVF